ncbi:efflux RND transporter periplasmic adaptor subunit [Anaeromyxobacter oryzae]|uniref:MexH family multidrug efflux RND transporter periplasmic adaptor subunit n=1 Tax=Anaeromyxobacter oryzae TaxID=2918170 RepID=A0ABM7WP59_9BACT|nr:efflux RND transporter periplasmic adaptor subunit [Anaeromyxobacter oryzae]BDG01257.1 MexH family multidrug efflux RND transporter periplasmic adaptor subunit [Anaeromyxobacter oryzae]
MTTRTAAAFAALLAVAACKKAESAPRTRPPPAVTVSTVSHRDVPAEIRAPVDLRPLEQADVGAKTLGYLDAVLVDRGDRVRRGQLLAVVRPSDLPDQLAAARGTLAQAQAAAALARANKERAERLAPGGFVSQQELQQDQTNVATADATLAAAQANVGALATRLGEMRIESPLDGFVAVRRLDPGALVGPTAGSGAILTVQRLDVLRVFVPVNERDVERLKIGEEARVELDALPGRPIQGRVVRIAPAFDPVARTLDAEVQIPNPTGVLRPGMYGRAAIVTDVHRDAVVVPASAVQISNERSFVFVLKGDKVSRLPIRTGVDGGDWLEVVDGLSHDDQIVTAGMDVLSDGAAVRAQKNVDPFSGRPLTATTP